MMNSSYKRDKAQLLTHLAEIQGHREVRKGLHALADLADQCLKALWHDCGLPASLSLVAVGGFGRGELFPHSDVDVLILLPDAMDDRGVQSQIENFIGQCWDAGLEIGSSVRNLDECLEQAQSDVTVQTALLESRLLVGDAALYERFNLGLMQQMDVNAFVVAKSVEMRQRHTKFEGTPYALEPNCKESPGGLRDLQIILWLSKAAGWGSTWDDLQKSGLATHFEVKQLKRYEAVIGAIRMRLHVIAKRREDRLVFDLQTAVAESFGDQAVGTRRASEALMQRYYWAAKAVTQLNQVLLLNIQERLNPASHELRPINPRFNEKAGMLDVVSDDLYEQQPRAVLETFYLYQSLAHIQGLSARTLRALYNSRSSMNAAFRADPANRVMFMQILQCETGITHAMRLMNQTSVLGRYLWVFRRIVGQMQHDLFHVYTVDQHILMVLRNMRRFFMPEHAHEYPFCSQLAASWDKPWVLYAAALFHDIAKGRGGDHSDLGRYEVRKFAHQHGVIKADADLIEFLVAEHLGMSHVAQKQDLGDPDVIAAFAKRVGNARRLTALYLLTVADIRGTSPKVWNAWKGKLLEDLYRYTLRWLQHEERVNAAAGSALALTKGAKLDPSAPAPRSHSEAELEVKQREALEQLRHSHPASKASAPGVDEQAQAVWSRLDVSYFMRHDASSIAWHTEQLIPRLQTPNTQPLVRARPSPASEGLEVLVYTPDQSDLFARICGHFEQMGLSILDARIHTTRDAHALDSFQVVSADNLDEDETRALIERLEASLSRALGQTDAKLPAPGKGRQSRRVKSFPFQPRVELLPDEKSQRWVLSISASDRLGLLYAVAQVLARHQVNLQLAKISTLGERVEDTLLVDGAALQDSRTQLKLETELLEVLAA
jgi:[protein-PII] uridylyltransferase